MFLVRLLHFLVYVILWRDGLKQGKCSKSNISFVPEPLLSTESPLISIESPSNTEKTKGGNEAAVKEEKISLSVPQLSEEETRSNHMPDHLRCDACLAVAYQISRAFEKGAAKRSLQESDIIDLLEHTCTKNFDEYGVKQVDNINRLSGPGLETEKVMGMTQMGGRWSHRLQEMCHYYLGEVGEMDLYNIFKEGKKMLSKSLCFGKGIYSHCTSRKPVVKSEL